MSITGMHNLQVLRGLSGNRSLLSARTDGSAVDLWHADDNSGRQQWKLIPVTGLRNVYNIALTSGISATIGYLNCSPEGDKVDLIDRDDGSDRQQWELIPVPDSPTCSTYLIRVRGGVVAQQRYLSCRPDGSAVELVIEDDGSGRQRWQLQGVWVA